MAENHLGTDIAFQDDITAIFGDVDLVEGRKCLLQDIRLRLTTPRGDLWCHPDYGIDLYRFLHLEGTAINRLDLVRTIEEEAAQDPRGDSVNVTLTSWDGYTVKVIVIINPVDGGNPINLVIGYDLATMTVEVLSGA